MQILAPLVFLDSAVDTHRTLDPFVFEEVGDPTFNHDLEIWHEKTQSEDAHDKDHQTDWSNRVDKINVEIIFKLCSFGVKQFNCFQYKLLPHWLIVIVCVDLVRFFASA